jgi:hypothetical protein
MIIEQGLLFAGMTKKGGSEVSELDSGKQTMVN